jgi:hypothetical protein
MVHSHVPVVSQSTPAGSAPADTSSARGLYIAGNFTLSVTAFYELILLGAIFAAIALTGNVFFPDLGTYAGMAYTAQYPTAVVFGYIADAVGNTVFVVTIAAVFVALRTRRPMWAQLILLAGFGSLLAVWGKALVSVDMASSLSASYLAAGTAGKAALLPLGGVAAAITQGLQDLDTYSLIAAWILIAFLPKATGMPRLVRWMGVALSVAFVLPFGPIGFFIATVLTPAWAIPLGLWLKRQATAHMTLTSTATGAGV